MPALQRMGLLLSLILTGTTPFAYAAEKLDAGQREFEENCAVCHGSDLRSGAYVDFLTRTPPDLTQLASRNGGVFPLERVYRVIDGRQSVAAHGPKEMPIWGRDYQIKAGAHYVDINYDPEIYVRGRILSLIDYLNRMQAR